ncbi:MAG: short-chain fatty acid transporter [Candidatus Hydrogenedentes bacterium]|nr:short-chain fatty acid transporter [Candidatus Hydrogenedentota bacterium]
MAHSNGQESDTTPPQRPSPERESWMDWLARISERLVPDAFTTAIVLMVILAALALFLGNTVTETVDAYYRGLWMLLAFTMQMTLMLTLSLVLAETRPFKFSVVYLSRIPKSATQVVIGVVLCTAVLAYSNWALSIALGPMVAIHFCKQAERKGIPVDFNWIMAVIAGAGSIWQFGMSSTAPLQMTAPDNFLAKTTGAMPLSTTIWSPAALTMVISFIIVTAVVGVLFMPKKVKPISHFQEADKLAEAAITADYVPPATIDHDISFAQKMERTSITLIPMWIALGAWIFYHFVTMKASLDINSMITILLLACLLLHRTVGRFTEALQRVIVSTWPVVVLYHLYAGVAGLIQFTDVGNYLATMVEPIATPMTLPLLTAIISTVVAIFIPTSGGQWQIQGFVTVSAAEAAGITAQRGLLALSVGDHMGNLISPFWTVVGAGIARVDFRKLFGYRLIFAAIWFVMGVIIFTFLPC